MADFTEQQKEQARQQFEKQLKERGLPRDLEEQQRRSFETALLQKDVEVGPGSNDYFGADTWDAAVDRYRDRGAQRRDAVQLDQRQADQTRGLQMGALGTLENAVRGNAPSQAAITGQMQHDQILQQNTQAMGGARGVGGQLTAARAAGGAMNNQLVGSLAGTTLARAGEANQDRNTFAGAAGQVRGQDIGAATTNAELVAKSRAQDEARQQSYERMGWQTRNAQLGSNVELQRQEDAKRAEIRRLQSAEATRDSGAGKTAASAGTAAMMAGLSFFFSDERTKHELPIGSLGHIGRR